VSAARRPRRLRGIGPPSRFYPAGGFRAIGGWRSLPREQRSQAFSGVGFAILFVLIAVAVLAAIVWLVGRL
jgi:hypothetical protein